MQGRWRNLLNKWLAVNASGPKQKQREQLFNILLTGLLALGLALTVINVIQWAAAPSPKNMFLVVSDVSLLLAFVGLWGMSRSGHTQWACHGLLILLVIACSTLLPIRDLDRTLIIYAAPIVAASFLIGPDRSFVFALLSALGYSLARLADGNSLTYNYVSVASLFMIALLTWVIAARQEKDITERQQAEEKYRNIFENAMEGIFQSTPQGRYLTVNPAMSRIYGYASPYDMIATVTDIERQIHVDPGSRQRFIQQLHSHGRVEKFEARNYRRDGSIIWTSTNAWAVRDAKGEGLYYEGFLTDITERKRAEAALRESEERYHIVSELTSDFAGAFHIGMDGIIMREWLTGAYTRITGFDVGGIDTHGIWITLVHPDDMPAAVRHLRTLFSGQPDVCELRIVTASGQVRWLSNSGRPVWDAAQGRVIRIYSASQDITERKRAEQALRESEAKLRTLFEILPVGVSILDAERKVSYVNSALGGILDISMEGLFRGDYNGRTILRPDGTLMPAEEYASVRALKEQRAVHNVETGVVTEAGKVIWVSVNAVPVAFPAWKVVVVTADITERKRAEEEIASLAKFPAENPDPVLRLSRDGIVIYANAASDALLGMWDCAVGSYAPQSWRDLIAQALASGQNKSIDVECAEKVYSFFVTPVAEAGYVNLYGRDITERKQAEERLRRETARAEALARIAARLNAQLDLDAVLNAVCEEAAHALNVPVASVALYQPENQAFVPAAVFGLPPQALQDIAPFSRALYPALFGTMEPSVVVPDLQAVPGLTNAEFYACHDIRTTAVVGLVREGDLVGSLSIHAVGQPRAFDADEQSLLKGLADQAVQAIANARLLAEIQQQRKQLRALSARLAAAEEAERRRLARELHDQVGQSLTALSINLNLVRSQLPDTSIKEKQRLDDSLTLVEETVEHIRDVMAELRPAVLDDYGLFAALRWQGERISRFAAVSVVVEGAELSPRLPQAIETTLFRIAQEALTNVTRHAQASQVRIALESLAGMARLTVADNGIGFDPQRREAGERPKWGVLTMRERIEAVGGRLRVESAPGRGTQVIVEAPLALPDLESAKR